MTVLDIARLFLFVREAGENNGQRVNAIQMFSGGREALGTSWCMWFATLILDLLFAGTSPIPRQGACEDVRKLAESNGWLTDTPSVGDLFLRVHADTGLAHHTGFVTAVNDDGSIGTIAGNTSEDGVSSNGDRVAEHTITPAAGTITYVAYPRS
jgi:hypothetical protein